MTSPRVPSLFRRLLDATAFSSGALAVAYLVFWGCAWGSSVRPTLAPPTVPLSAPPAGLADAKNELGVSVLPAFPASAGGVWVSRQLSEHIVAWSAVSLTGGFTGVGVQPQAGLRLVFDPIEDLRLGFDVGLYADAGALLTDTLFSSSTGMYMQPGLSVGMPVGWRVVDGFDLGGPDLDVSVYTNPRLAGGPSWGPYPGIGGTLNRVVHMQVPIGAAVRWDRFRFFGELGVQGTGGWAPKVIALPPPFPYTSLGVSYVF
jgi:hypothetical protein